MEESKEIQFVEAQNSDDWIERVQGFLATFVENQQILPRTRDELIKLFEHAFVAIDDLQVVGFVALEIYSNKLSEIQCLAVDDRYRRRGIGRELVNRCVTRAKQMGVRELMAISATDKMFLACGFDYSLPNQKRALFIQLDD